jgi:hypothetical protein
MALVQRARIDGLQCYPDMRYAHVITVVLLSSSFVFTFIPTLYLSCFINFFVLSMFEDPGFASVVSLRFLGSLSRIAVRASSRSRKQFSRGRVNTVSRCPPLVTLDSHH